LPLHFRLKIELSKRPQFNGPLTIFPGATEMKDSYSYSTASDLTHRRHFHNTRHNIEPLADIADSYFSLVWNDGYSTKYPGLYVFNGYYTSSRKFLSIKQNVCLVYAAKETDNKRHMIILLE
jgi:hypothetical protein